MALALFSYRRGNSVIHRTPTLLKLFMMVVLCIVVFWGGACETVKNALSIPVAARIASCLFLSILTFFLAGANWKTLPNLGFVFVIGFLITLLKIFYIPEFEYEQGAIEPLTMEIDFLPFLEINLDGLASGIVYTLRLFIAAFFAQTIYETTSSLEIKNALEQLQNFVAKIIPPIKKINPALAISLAINFIPQIFSTFEKVMLAAKSRSVTKKSRIKIPLKNYFFILKSLLMCLLQQAEETRRAVLARSNDVA